jgi:allantoinase
VGFWGGVVPGNQAELGPMVRAGALGFKCFTCFSGIDDFPASTRVDLLTAMPLLRELGVPLLVHAELESELKNANIDASSRSYKNYLHSRPSAWEDAAVAMVVELVALTGCRAHIVHLSSADALELVRRAKKQGLPITAETCPHYLGLSAEEVPDGATQFKCAPPIRERENQERLWAGLLDGTLDFVVTDHSPCIPALKRMEEGNFMDAWGGIASLQLGLRSVWTEAQRRGIALERLIGWMSAATAAFVGRPERGILREGGPADLVLFRPEHHERLEAATLLHRHPQSPWVGRRLAGAVEQTWMRGQPIWADGKINGEGAGKIYLGGRNNV